jgi:hypothetical protein
MPSGCTPKHWRGGGCLRHASSKTTASLLAPYARVRGHGCHRCAHSCPLRRCRHVARTPPCRARDRAERPESFRFCARAGACRLALRRMGRRARDSWAVSSRTGSQHLVLDAAVRCAVLPGLPSQTAEGRRLPRVRRSSLLHTRSDGDLPSRQEHGGVDRDDRGRARVAVRARKRPSREDLRQFCGHRLEYSRGQGLARGTTPRRGCGDDGRQCPASPSKRLVARGTLLNIAQAAILLLRCTPLEQTTAQAFGVRLQGDSRLCEHASDEWPFAGGVRIRSRHRCVTQLPLLVFGRERWFGA